MKRLLIYVMMVLVYFTVCSVAWSDSLGLSAKDNEKAPLPDNVSYRKPADDVPKNIQNLLGMWEGNWGGQLNSYIIFEEVTADWAIGIYGTGIQHSFGITEGGYRRITASLMHTGDESSIDFKFDNINGTLSADGKTINAVYRGQSTIVMKKIEDPLQKNKTKLYEMLEKRVVRKAIPPVDVVYQKPDNNVSQIIQGLLGQWEGDRNSGLNAYIIIEKVTSEKANIVHGWGINSSINAIHMGYFRNVAEIRNTGKRLSLSIALLRERPPVQVVLSADGKSLTDESGGILFKKTHEPVFGSEIKRYKKAVAGTVVFKNINLVTMRYNKIIPSQTVIIENGRIKKIGNSTSINIPAGASVIDGKDEKYLMPGLADMHVHLEKSIFLKLLVANGVTTVRNMFGWNFHLLIREDIKNKQRVGPVIYSTGALLDGYPPFRPLHRVVNTVEDAKNAVHKTKEDGFEFVKVYDGLSENVYDTIMSTARDLNIPVVGHIPFAVGFDKAVASGQYSFEHLLGATRNSYDWRTVREGNDLEEYLKKTVASGVWNCPTLASFKPSEMKRDELKKQPALKYMRKGTIESWETRPERILPDGMRQSRLDMVKALHDAGAKLILGTDFPLPWVIPGFSLHEELSRMVEAGLSPYEAIKTSTVYAAEHMMKQDEFGTVEEGKRADLILIDQNPFEDVRNINKPLGVMTNGVWYPRSMLDQMLHEVEQETKKLDID